MLLSVRQHICYSALYAIARPSVTWVVEVRIMQLSPLSSPMTLVFSRLTAPRNSKRNIGSGGVE